MKTQSALGLWASCWLMVTLLSGCLGCPGPGNPQTEVTPNAGKRGFNKTIQALPNTLSPGEPGARTEDSTTSGTGGSGHPAPASPLSAQGTGVAPDTDVQIK